MITVRPVENDADLQAWVAVKCAVMPDEPVTAEQLRRPPAHDRLLMLAELDGELAACGIADRSDDPRRGFVAPRVLPGLRRRGVGTALLEPLLSHVARLGLRTVGAHVDGRDPGSLVFAERFGFREVDREVEQVREIGSEPLPEPLPGVEVVSVAERPLLLEAAYDLAVEAYADFAVTGAIQISLEQWLADEATRPEGSFVALAAGEIVGYAGLMEHGDLADAAEHGLTAVRRAWRRRGIATLLKRTQLAWAEDNGVCRLVTWTQRGNEAMRALNERLGYEIVTESLTMRATLPVDRAP